ncbi:MAG: hypothetical protein JRJ87_01200 [Deltaproteobacteria bacterium]|nr:hypothetical protein [Deltaproteobacteria bacterium]
MNLREQINAAVLGAHFDQLEDLVAKETKAVRYLMGMSYQPENNIAETAAKGIGLAARYHPKLIKKILRRLIWAMDEQSGTNSYSAPLVLQAIARERPEFLLPIVPDLVRLSINEALHDGIADALCIVVHSCPGGLGASLTKRLNERIEKGKCCDGSGKN